jgi:hypothetical protein
VNVLSAASSTFTDPCDGPHADKLPRCNGGAGGSGNGDKKEEDKKEDEQSEPAAAGR